MTYTGYLEPNSDPGAGRLVTAITAAKHNLGLAADLDRVADLMLQRAEADLAEARTAKKQTREKLREAALIAVDQRFSEGEVSRMAGVTRMTIRNWRGKS